MWSRWFQLALCTSSALLIASGFHKLTTPEAATFQSGHGLIRIVFGTLVFVTAVVALVGGPAESATNEEPQRVIYDPYRVPH